MTLSQWRVLRSHVDYADKTYLRQDEHEAMAGILIALALGIAAWALVVVVGAML